MSDHRDPQAALTAAGDLFLLLAGDLYSLRGVVSSITGEETMEEAMPRLAAVEALATLLGQRADAAARRLGSVGFSASWTLSPRDQQLLDALGPPRQRGAAA
ncbi:MAG: hypothetical protein KF683_10500 [Rubrivivax sp.]|nr:hypothetical protein [Rubrivivax sp.]